MNEKSSAIPSRWLEDGAFGSPSLASHSPSGHESPFIQGVGVLKGITNNSKRARLSVAEVSATCLHLILLPNRGYQMATGLVKNPIENLARTGCRGQLRIGNPGNSGGKKGRSGRRPREIGLAARRISNRFDLLGIAAKIALGELGEMDREPNGEIIYTPTKNTERLAAIRLIWSYAFGNPATRQLVQPDENRPLEIRIVDESRNKHHRSLDTVLPGEVKQRTS
jgi:hypothetical protein